ncbi:O-antigen ligase family protein [Acidobacteriota bacterium]
MKSKAISGSLMFVRSGWLFGYFLFVGSLSLLSLNLEIHDFAEIAAIFLGLTVLIYFLIKTSVNDSFPTIPELVLLLFLVPGTINLSFSTELRVLKTTIGIDLNGIRLILFCIAAAIIIISWGKVEKVFVIFFVFLAVGAASLCYTPDLLEGFRFFLKLLVPYFVYVLSKQVSHQSLERINRGFLLVVFLHMPFVFETLFKWLKQFDPSRDIPRAMGLSGGRVILGTFMVFAFVLFSYRRSLSRDGHGWIYLAFSVMAVFAIILSGARIAWVALAIAALLLGLLKNIKVLALIGMILLILIILFQPLLEHRLGLEIKDGKIGMKGAGGGTAEHRFTTWKVLWERDISPNLLLGNGLGSSKKLLSFTNMDYPHNEYIRILLELGVVGFALFCFAFLYLSVFLLRKTKNLKILIPISVFLVLSLAGNTLNNYFENAAICAYLLAYIERTSEER